MEYVITTAQTSEVYTTIFSFMHRIANLQHYNIPFKIHAYDENGQRIKFSIEPKDSCFE